ncbi:MAG TPA: NUDIX hydrolase [Candidatus Obscuribacterales bacterium]
MALFTRQDTVESNRIYDGYIINLRVDTLRSNEGSETTREVVEHNGGVVIICQPEPSKVVLIRQYRYAIDEELLELPAGRIERGEDPFLAAKRELTEETGYIAETWCELSRMYSAPGFCSELLYLYLATDVRLGEKCPDYDEHTEVMVFPIDDAWELVINGHVRDAKTVAGIGLLANLAKISGG